MVATKTWTPGPEARNYSIGEGPFAVRTFSVDSLDAVAALVGACPSNAFVVRGFPVSDTIPYRRHVPRPGEPPTLKPQGHRWLAIDVDAPGPLPRTDIPAMAAEARALLPEAFHGARMFALATSSAGIKPGIRVRLWTWLSREVSDKEVKEWLRPVAQPKGPVDLAIYTPSQPCYCAPPAFEGVEDPFATLPRTAWLDGTPEVQVPEAFEAHARDPLEGFGEVAAGAVPGNRNTHLTSLAGSMRKRGMSPEAMHAALSVENAQLSDPLPSAEVEAIARSVGRYAPDASHAPVLGARTWSEDAVVNEDGALIPCAENFALLLKGHPAFGLWLNSRTGKPVWSACPWRAPGTPVSDGDDFQMMCWLARERIWFKAPCDILQGIAEVAAARPYDPWKGFLDQLTWDGTPRLATAAKRLLGDTTLTAGQMFSWWLISACARSYVPGIQADHMISLEGPQGIGKTTFLRELAIDGAFFTRLSAHSELGNVRVIGKIHGPVIVELAELDTLRRAGTAAMKAFIDERIDRVQWLYSRTQVDVARSCIFAGTANDKTYLEDDTGNRRYWPIACTKINLPQLKLEREQLWAEAAHRYKAGEKWWPAAEDNGKLEELQEDRRKVSAAEETIAAALEATYTPGIHVLTGTTFHVEQLAPGGRLLWITTAQLCSLAKCKDYEAQAAMRAIKWNPSRARLLTGASIRAYIRRDEGR